MLPPQLDEVYFEFLLQKVLDHLFSVRAETLPIGELLKTDGVKHLDVDFVRCGWDHFFGQELMILLRNDLSQPQEVASYLYLDVFAVLLSDFLRQLPLCHNRCETLQ